MPLTCNIINLLLLNIGGHIFEVYGLQEFYRQPENITATQGATVYLKCIIKNKGSGEVQWTKGGFGLGIGTSLPVYERYSVVSQSEILPSGDELEEFSLKIIDVSLFDDDYYQCQVTATEESPGLVSYVAYINVLVPPKQPLLLGGPTISVVLNKPSNITCLALHGKPKAEIIWKKDDVRVTQNTYEINTTQPDDKLVDAAGVITITAQLSDVGMRLECGSWNEAMAAGQPYWTQATLDVLYKPKVTITHNSSSGVIKEFDDIEFVCTAEANPNEIHWKWFRDQVEFYGEHRNTLLIQNIPRDYHGNTISCQATNSVGSTTAGYSMNILYGPRFIMEPSNVSVDVGQRAELRCVADGNPRPEISWRKSAQFHVLHVGPNFEILYVGEEEFGVYICTATVLGFSEVSQEVYLTHNDALLDERRQIDGSRVPTKVWLEAADDTVTVHWTPPVNVDDVSFCTISYKANTNPVEVRIPVSKVQRMHVITGLNRSTLYKVRLYCLYGSSAGPSTVWFGAATRTVSFEPSVCTGSLPHAVLEPYCLEHTSFGWCKFSCQDGYRKLEVPAAIHDRRARVEDYTVFLTLLTCSNGTWVTWYEDRAYGINDLCLPEAEFQRCPISIPNGVLEPNCGPATDWLCKFECNSGYLKHVYMSGKLKGVYDDPYMLYCEDGVWKTGYEALGVDVSGVCYAEDNECTSSNGIQNGRITHLPCPSGATCDFECDPGFHRHALARDYPACIDGILTLRTTKYDPSITLQTLCVSDDAVGVCPPTISNGRITDPVCTVKCSPACNQHYHAPNENGPAVLSCEDGKWITDEAAYSGDNICFPECCCSSSHNNVPEEPQRNESTAAPPSNVFLFCFPEGEGGHLCPLLIPNGISTKDVYQRTDDGHTRRRVSFKCNEGFRKHRSVPYIECIAGNWVTAQERFGLDISSVCVPNYSYYI